MPPLILKASEWLLQRFAVPFLEWVGREAWADWTRHHADRIAAKRKKGVPMPTDTADTDTP